MTDYIEIDKPQFDKLFTLACDKWQRILMEECQGLLIKDEVKVKTSLLKDAIRDADAIQTIQIREILNIPQTNTKLIVGNWYRLPSKGQLAFKFSGDFISSDGKQSFGIGEFGEWSEVIGVYEHQISEYEPLDSDEVKDMLIRVARSKYKIPQAIRYLDNPSEIDQLNGFDLTYNPHTDTLYASGGETDIVYQDGVWTNPVETLHLDIREASDKLSSITGKKVIINY